MPLLHASCVALEGRGLLILGRAGAGKSGLALHLMALGCQLVADDQVDLTRIGAEVFATAPARLHGLIEARGLGLIRAEPCARAKIDLVIDLDRTEPDRLPPKREILICECPLPLVLRGDAAHFPYGLLQLLRGGRHA